MKNKNKEANRKKLEEENKKKQEELEKLLEAKRKAYDNDDYDNSYYEEPAYGCGGY